MTSKYVAELLVDELLKQKDGHDSLVTALKQRIDHLSDELEKECNTTSIHFRFLRDNHPELIEEFVKLAYSKNNPHYPHDAKYAVEGFHDETLDLSTIPCTGTDFKPWSA